MADKDLGIAMWGASGSGKSTLLAALFMGLAHGDGWKIAGSDEKATNYLIKMTTLLEGARSFPPPTRQTEHYRWTLIGPEGRHRSGWRRWLRPRYAPRIPLEVIDAPGDHFLDPDQDTDPEAHKELIDRLVDSRGIIFLYDPVRELTNGDSFMGLYAPLLQLTQRMITDPGLARRCKDGKLPHHVAICITKLDDQRVLRTAERIDVLDTDPDDDLEIPQVGGERAKELFQSLQQVSPGAANLVLKLLESHFHEDRVEFFATSSIGFYVDPAKGFDRHDFVNVLPVEDVSPDKRIRIRGQVRPINVIEPVIWLGQRMAAR
ncbi:hypothetical protein [Herbidospora sp. RD11066]